MEAAAFGLAERVQYLAKRGASYVNATNKDGDTALMRASKHGEMTIIKYLVQLCAVDVNAKNSRGYTALLVAAEFGKIEVVRYLAGECGADANAQNAIGDTALMMAVVHGNVNLVRYLAYAKYASISPDCPSGDAHELVWRMCCQDPHKRASLSSVAYELACLVIKESSDPCQELTSLEEYDYGTIQGEWLKLQQHMKNCDNSQYRQGFEDIKKIHECLQESTIHPTLLAQFHALITNFHHTVKMSPEQARIMRLASTSGTTNSLYALHWRIESLKASLGKTSVHGAKGRELRWQQQRSEQSELFISGVADPNLLLKDLKTPEERLALLQTLRGEMDNSTGKYTPNQLGTMEKTFEEIAGKIETEDLTEPTPEWFIPSYELIVDEWNCLGEGGFGSVNRATWLNSKVVVKRLKLAGSDGNEDNCHTLSASLWDHLKQIHGQIDGNSKCRVAFCTLVADAYASTSNLQGMEVTYISLTETAIRCHSLRRRLDKLKDAYFLSVRASTAGGYFPSVVKHFADRLLLSRLDVRLALVLCVVAFLCTLNFC
ncbi:hypothetical protein KRP22_014929 [Phytophthora ramorum]|nr:Ankyrin-like protein [Phytophthora ramorum]